MRSHIRKFPLERPKSPSRVPLIVSDRGDFYLKFDSRRSLGTGDQEEKVTVEISLPSDDLKHIRVGQYISGLKLVLEHSLSVYKL